MAQTLQHKRGITSALAPQVGTIGEIMMDTTKNTLVVMDGVTAGGHPMATENYVRNMLTSGGSSNNSFSGSYTDLTNKPTIPVDISDLTDTEGLLVAGEGLGTITRPAVAGGTYKGLQVSYGMVYGNTSWEELSVNKIVIHKPVNPTVTIHPTSSRDDFEVDGIGSSDVLAMFIVYSDTNGPKSLSTLQTFAEAAIDTIVLTNAQAGVYNTVDQMKAAFNDNYQTLVETSEGLYTDFEFYRTNIPTINGGTTTVRQGSGATFDIINNGNGTYSAGIVSGGTNYLPGHKIKILGTNLNGDTPDNDCIITVNAANTGVITSVSSEGNAGQAATTTYSGSVTGSDYTSGGLMYFDGGTIYVDNSRFTNSALLTAIQNAPVGTVFTITINQLTPGTEYTFTTNSVLTSSQFTGTTTVPGGVSAPAIMSISFIGTGGSETYTAVSGTNHNVGSGFIVSEILVNENTANNISISINSIGTNYVAGDVLTLLGANITGGTTPTNNITITVNNVDGEGQAYNYNFSGTAPLLWPLTSMNDGGADQYDTDGNTISTNLAATIAYNNGETVVNSNTVFGAGSSYSFAYEAGIFGLFVRGSSATSLSTSGNSGADGDSITEAGLIYDAPVPEQTFDNAVNYINVVPQDPYANTLVSFTHADNGNQVDILIADDGNGAGVGITRGVNQGIYNPYRDEDGWSSSVSPSGTLWNIEGWNDLSDIESRNYTNFNGAFGGNLGNQVVGTECIMYLPDNGKYYAVKFTQWTQNGQGGGFAYTRQEIDVNKVQYGIRFNDGTTLTSAEGIGRVKLRAANNRRIEEVHGFNSVAVTEKAVGNTITSTAFATNADNTNSVVIDATGAAYTNLIGLANGPVQYSIQVSLDQNNWITGQIIDGSDQVNVVVAFYNQARLPVTEDDTVYYRTVVGGEPVRWWDKADLPGGSSNFRGAVIDYHAYTNSGSIVGTIHIVDDDGDEYITHTEVASGGSSAEFIDLWFVDTEGSICFRRTDGVGSALRIQWTAKVFYGSQTYD
jgi:hypothetical protein